ncbi:MAG: glycine cleavage system protein GcvH [Candidatus Thalassarchaeaceae archaeon]|jgi:glycine cleavage system H protein|nr:glycine cleavage system protein GcvH [Candidatus Thalassarchaeaceae archaeon]|tara:strand:- start:95 stop:478 length:384 start_codon:yes stop_codon:yes gene_type:complete
MSNVPDNLRYTKEHEWVHIEGNVATVGITDYAQNALTDIVWVEFLSDVGDFIKENGSFASVESVKSVSEIYAPLAGELLELNQDLQDAPEMINENAYDAWIAKFQISTTGEIDSLLDAASYSTIIGD